MWRVLLPLIVMLGGCMATPPPQVLRSDITGLHGVVSDVARVSDHPHHLALARTVIVARDGAAPVHAIEIARSYDGVHPGLRMTSAWAFGRALPYRRARLATPFCQTRQCSARLIGTVFLTAPMFEAAASTGFRIRLLGPDGGLDVAVPPKLFAQARQLAAAQRLD